MSTIQHVAVLSAVAPGDTVSVTAGDLDYPSRYTHEIYWGPLSDDLNAFNHSPLASSSNLAGESLGSMEGVDETVLRRLLSAIWQALKTFGKFINRVGRMNFFGSAWL